MGATAAAVPEVVRGRPFTRTYPLEEIENVPRGARLGFDGFGRIAVMYEGVYAVLNDTAWLELADGEDRGTAGMGQVVEGRDGRRYYGAGGSWGWVETTPGGKLRPHPLQPAELPRWAVTSSFVDIVTTEAGLLFAGWGGVVFLERGTNRSVLVEVPNTTKIFTVGERVYLSAHNRPLQRIDVVQGRLELVEGPPLDGGAVEYATTLDQRRALLTTRDGRLWEFDGTQVRPWPGQERAGLSGQITGVQQLVDGGVAIAINGQGLFLTTVEGEVFCALTTPEYHRVDRLATREAGVLWVSTESAVEKVLYGSPLTVLGQPLGLAVRWPTVISWQDRILVESRGRLFEGFSAKAGWPMRFEPMPTQPPGGAWAVATNHRGDLLVGNSRGVQQLAPHGELTPVLQGMDTARLAMVGEDLCYAIGGEQIAALAWRDGRWAECAPRIPAAGFPSVVTPAHPTRGSVWIELGANRVARLVLRDGQLHLRVFDQFPWENTQWINVGVVDDTVALAGPPGERVFFDEATERFVDAPPLRAWLEQCPGWIVRVVKDRSGFLWATHHKGVTLLVPEGAGYRVERELFDLINERYPLVQVSADLGVWVSTGQSLYRVDRSRLLAPPPVLRPTLVSAMDSRTSRELFEGSPEAAEPWRLPFAQNSLSLRFFAGGYAWRRSPVYEFRLHGGDERWTSLGSGSLLSLPGLREGHYRLEVRIAGPADDALGTTTAWEFEILPPWRRTGWAYALYSGVAGLAVFGLVRWSSHRARCKNLRLEQLVQERTEQLTTTMAQLNEETRTSATLAERDRLAGEIHDSLQQGLSGLILQLDATLKLPALSAEVRSRLHVARNMVSFTRHEVQHAIWDMESPLLEGTELGDALRKIAALIGQGGASLQVEVTGVPAPLPSATKHHLLRIAQEAITNAVRHGQPRTIRVGLDYGATGVTLVVSDDGVGFSPDAVLARGAGHFGLRGLRGRAAKIHGDLHIESAPGCGTSIRMAVPLTALPPS